MTVHVEVENSKVTRRPGQYPLKSDAVAGFREAVYNNQQTLAFEYLRYIVDALLEAADTLELDARVSAIEASLAPSRKVTKAASAVAE